MECDLYERQPESTFGFLVQQVEEQSEFCDTIIKQGGWEKSFHRCMLVNSPFFECALRHGREKHIGTIELMLGSPAAIDMAIMFLYGKEAMFSTHNIGKLLQMAEFLLIPSLKSACIHWINRTDITAENCMDLITLASMYDFDVPNCTEYIKGHMIEVLQSSKALDLTKESIVSLFTTDNLTYFLDDDKLNFLRRWVKRRPEERKVHISDLASGIDLGEVNTSLLEEIMCDENFNDMSDVVKYLNESKTEFDKNLTFIMKGDDGYPFSFWCLDMNREKWFRVHSNAYTENIQGLNWDIIGTGNNDSDLYLINDDGCESSILIINLKIDTCRNYKIVKQTSDESLCNITCASMADDNLILSKQKYVMTDRYEMRTYRIYFGTVSEENINMFPLLSFKNKVIKDICMNKLLTVAIIFRSAKGVYLYDLIDYKLEIINIVIDYEDTLVKTANGFIMYNRKRFILFTKEHESMLSSRYQVKEIQFSWNQNYIDKYFFSSDMFFHYYCTDYIEEMIFQCFQYNSCMADDSSSLLKKPLPLPKQICRCCSETISGLFKIRLTKEKLRCSIECPHCTDVDDMSGPHSYSDTDVNSSSDYEYYSDYDYY